MWEVTGPSIHAHCVVHAQELGMEKLRQASQKRKFDFCIAANMFDETKLPFDKLARTRSCLVLACKGHTREWGQDTGRQYKKIVPHTAK